MKADKASLERALKAPQAVRLFLFHGPDEAASRALMRRVGAGVGDGAERIDLSGADLKSDPARLSDEAAAFSMFGGPRWLLVEPAGEECLAAVEALLESPAGTTPAVLMAGNLKGTSKLLKRIIAAPDALAFASYLPEARDADRLVAEIGRAYGLQIRTDLAQRIAESCGMNRGIIEQELAKLALYLDASPEAPKPLDDDAVEAVGAKAEEGDLSRLTDAVAGGDLQALSAELDRLKGEGLDGIVLIRAVLKRMALLTRLRADVEAGSSVAAVMASKGKSLFWKEQKPISAQLARWRGESLAKSISRLVEAERQVKAPGGLGAVAVEEELFAICRQAARGR